MLTFLPEILLHVSRGVRWDSDHVVILTDDLEAIAQELVRGDFLVADAHRPRLLRRQHQPRRRLGDRHAQHAQGAAAWRCSSRSAKLRDAARRPATTPARLALLEELKTLPFGRGVGSLLRNSAGVPVGRQWLDEVKEYERAVLSARS